MLPWTMIVAAAAVGFESLLPEASAFTYTIAPARRRATFLSESFGDTLQDKLIQRAELLLANDLGVQNESLLDPKFMWIGPNVGSKALGKRDYLASAKFFDLRSTFPDLDYRAHDFRIDEQDPMTVRVTARVVGTMRGKLRLRNKVIPPNGKQMRCPPEAISMTFDEKTGRLLKLCSGFAMDRLVGNTGGLCGVMGAATMAGSPPSDWESYPATKVVQRFFGRPDQRLEEPPPFLAPFPETVMIQLAKGIFSASMAIADSDLLAPSFVYYTAYDGPIRKDAYLKKYASKIFNGLEPELSYFRVDPYDPYRVWVDVRPEGMTLDGVYVDAPPQAFSFTFDDEGFCTRFTAGAVMDPSIGNTGGLCGYEGELYAAEKPAPEISTRPLPQVLDRLRKLLLSPITKMGVDDYGIAPSQKPTPVARTSPSPVAKLQAKTPSSPLQATTQAPADIEKTSSPPPQKRPKLSIPNFSFPATGPNAPEVTEDAPPRKRPTLTVPTYAFSPVASSTKSGSLDAAAAEKRQKAEAAAIAAMKKAEEAATAIRQAQVEVAEAEWAKKAAVEVAASSAPDKRVTVEEEKKLAASDDDIVAEKKLASETKADEASATVRNMVVPDKTFVSKDVGPRETPSTGRDYLSGLGGGSPVKKAPARGKPRVATKTMGSYLENMSRAAASYNLSAPDPIPIAPVMNSAPATPSAADSRARENAVTTEQEKKLAAADDTIAAEKLISSEKSAEEAAATVRNVLVPDETFVSKDVGPSVTPATRRGYLTGSGYLSGLGGGSPLKKAPARGKPKVASSPMSGYLDNMSSFASKDVGSSVTSATKRGYLTGSDYLSGLGSGFPVKKAPARGKPKVATKAMSGYIDNMSRASPTSNLPVPVAPTVAPGMTSAPAAGARESVVTAEQERKTASVRKDEDAAGARESVVTAEQERKTASVRKDEDLAAPRDKKAAFETRSDEAAGTAASKALEKKEKAEQEEKSKIAADTKAATSTKNESPVESIIGVVAPLKYMGPYPCLTLRFPNLSTPEQKTRNVTGVSLDFVLDTGANVNTIDARLADQLALQLCASSKDLNITGSAGVGGTFLAGDIFLLGDCQLDGLPPGNDFTFMTNLTAAALPHASPVGHGLLSLSFFLSFPAGVEFDWYGTDGDPPTVIFYYGKEPPENVKSGLTRVPLERLAAQVLSLTINVNGTDMPALLDTGSPITVMNHAAAKLAGIETVQDPSLQPIPQRPQAYGDESLTVRGVDSGLVDLSRSVSPVPIRAGTVSLGEGPVYVGDLPGLALVGKLSNSSAPGVVLGLDSLRRSYRMILRVSENELWFEELPKR